MTVPIAAIPAGSIGRDVLVRRVSWWVLWVAFGVVVVLSLASPMRRTGDAHQYHAMAWAMARGHGPSLDGTDQQAWNAWLAEQPESSGFPGAVPAMRQPALVRDERQHFSHFWVYPLLAVPGVAVSGGIGVHPGYAFVLVNAVLAGVALWQVGKVIHPGVALLLLGTPLVWFIGKAQVEVFTWALLTLAMVAALQGRFLMAGLWAAVASTQNLPIAGAVVVFWVAALWHRRRTVPMAHWRAAVIMTATLLMTLLHPVSTRATLGVTTPQELNGGILAATPTLSRVLALLVDPDIGMVAWVPLLVVLSIVGVVIVIRLPEQERVTIAPVALCAVVIGGGLLVACAKTTNVNSGGSLWMSRYVMWMLPLTLPFLAALTRTRFRASWWLPTLGVVTVAVYLWVFAPWRPEVYVMPSPQSELAYRVLPGVPKPIPEVFWERRAHRDGGVQGSAASATCEVILLYAADMAQPCSIDRATQDEVGARFAAGDRAVWVIAPIWPRQGPPRISTAIGAP